MGGGFVLKGKFPPDTGGPWSLGSGAAESGDEIISRKHESGV